MTILKLAVTVASKGLIGNSVTLRHQTPKLMLYGTSVMCTNNRYASCVSGRTSSPSAYKISPLTKSMNLLSVTREKLSLEKHVGRVPEAGMASSLKLSPNVESSQPLVVMLSWLMSKPKHLHKYAQLYLNSGFDVLTLRLTPWQLLWPTKGSQLVARDLFQFLDSNNKFSPILVHGFSVGGYLWGEMLALALHDKEKFAAIKERIVGSIWDSAADMQDIQTGLPIAVFPNNMVLQSALRKYVKYHMRTFYDGATSHYIRSSQMFHSCSVRTPALMMFSKKDPIGNPESNLRVRDNWEALGIKTYVKCWEKSPHVGHYHKYPEEYVAEITAFMAKLGLIAQESQMQAKL